MERKSLPVAILSAFIFLTAASLVRSQTIWNGPNLRFTKVNGADWTLAENQDRITENVWLTRRNIEGLINYKIEPDGVPYVWLASPIDTEWAFSGIENSEFNYGEGAAMYASLSFSSFTNSLGTYVGSNIKLLPGVLHLITDDIYIDIIFTSWTTGTVSGEKGGFSYVRKTDGETFDVVSVSPNTNSHNATISTNITATFEENLEGGTVDDATFVAHSSSTGKVLGPAAKPSASDGSWSASGSTATLNPNDDFMPGEIVQLTVTNGVQSAAGAYANPFVWQIRTAVGSGGGTFTDSGQDLETLDSRSVCLGDVDGDGDLDAFVANEANPNQVWLNDGNGTFSSNGQDLGIGLSQSVVLGDVDNDGDLDAFVANYNQANKVWMNDGSGTFTDSGQNLGDSKSNDVALGDVDGDGDLDAFVGNNGQDCKVWLNDGGTFSDSSQELYSGYTQSVALGDVDGDGDLDAFVANDGGEANMVYLNNGIGIFTCSGQTLGTLSSRSVSLGDIDGDGDLDAFMVNYGHAARVWVNADGNGTFTSTDLASTLGRYASLGDVDGDGDLDAFVVFTENSNRVWLNSGSGTFTDSGQELGSQYHQGVSLGDLDGDGDLDAFVANYGQGNTVWWNGATAVDKQDQGNNLPDRFQLCQNYPNPFNPQTTIAYNLPQASEVTMTIYNMIGEKVADLFVGRKEAGSHSVTWDAGGYPSGTYFIQLTTGSFTQMRKCVLLK